MGTGPAGLLGGSHGIKFDMSSSGLAKKVVMPDWEKIFIWTIITLGGNSKWIEL